MKIIQDITLINIKMHEYKNALINYAYATIWNAFRKKSVSVYFCFKFNILNINILHIVQNWYKKRDLECNIVTLIAIYFKFKLFSEFFFFYLSYVFRTFLSAI